MPGTVVIEGQGELVLTFGIKEDGGTYDFTEDEIGKIAAVTGDAECGAGSDDTALLGQVVSVSSDGKAAGVKVKGILKSVPYDTAGTVPALGDSVQFSDANEVDKAASVNLARGVVIAKDTTAGTVDILL